MPNPSSWSTVPAAFDDILVALGVLLEDLQRRAGRNPALPVSNATDRSSLQILDEGLATVDRCRSGEIAAMEDLTPDQFDCLLYTVLLVAPVLRTALAQLPSKSVLPVAAPVAGYPLGDGLAVRFVAALTREPQLARLLMLALGELIAELAIKNEMHAARKVREH